MEFSIKRITRIIKKISPTKKQVIYVLMKANKIIKVITNHLLVYNLDYYENIFL
jgi:histidyl-tRNA synthetase